MKKGGGKGKGSGFERKIAKMIVKAFKKHKINQRECWRSINSGGHVVACGDLEMSDRLMKLFPYSIECKFRKKIKWQFFLQRPLNRKAEEIKWLAQAQEGAKKIKGMTPLLVIKENHGKIYAMYMDTTLIEFSKFLKQAVDRT